MATSSSSRPKLEPAAFESAGEAWFWTVDCLEARHAGAQRGQSRGPGRPAAPEDVLRCLDRLYQAGKIRPAHARVLRSWGDRRHAPDSRSPAADRTLWGEAMAALEDGLRERGLLGSVEIGK